jgi:hypothetical protein
VAKGWWRRPGVLLEAFFIIMCLPGGFGTLASVSADRPLVGEALRGLAGAALALAGIAMWRGGSGAAVLAARLLLVFTACGLLLAGVDGRLAMVGSTLSFSVLWLVFLFKSATVRRDYGPVTWRRITFRRD